MLCTRVLPPVGWTATYRPLLHLTSVYVMMSSVVFEDIEACNYDYTLEERVAPHGEVAVLLTDYANKHKLSGDGVWTANDFVIKNARLPRSLSDGNFHTKSYPPTPTHSSSLRRRKPVKASDISNLGKYWCTQTISWVKCMPVSYVTSRSSSFNLILVQLRPLAFISVSPTKLLLLFRFHTLRVIIINWNCWPSTPKTKKMTIFGDYLTLRAQPVSSATPTPQGIGTVPT